MLSNSCLSPHQALSITALFHALMLFERGMYLENVNSSFRQRVNEYSYTVSGSSFPDHVQVFALYILSPFALAVIGVYIIYIL